jgi:protein phosphatase
MSHRYLSIEPDPFPTPAACTGVPLRVAARTDRGLDRTNNEDRAAFADLRSDLALEPPAATRLDSGAQFIGLVCDGMGGEAGGEIASRLAVETILPFLRRSRAGEVATDLVKSIEAASERIREEARANPVYARMGTTATLGAVVNRALVCAQVGDSRAYVLHGGDLAQITRDQTLAELLRRSGAVDEIVGSNVILQAVGSSARLDIAITHTPLQDGDVILLCSDGLSGVVPDDVIAEVLATETDPDAACRSLIGHALERGAPDNVTCLVARLA